MIKKIIAVVALGLMAVSCATSPDNIKPVVTAVKTCSHDDMKRLNELTALQAKKASQDVITVWAVGLPLASMTSKENHEQEIAELKGRCQ